MLFRSCFLLSMENDSIDGIYNTLKECAQISKWAGGIGLHIHNIRATGSQIRGTNGTSNGVVPMLRVFNDTARYVDQGGGKRNGSFAIYLETWHADIFEFLDLKKNHGDEEMRARDLFYAMWIPSLFMEKVEKNEDWYLFCPDVCKILSDVYGEQFNKIYHDYVNQNKFVKKVKARDLWFKILDSQMETGTPYLLYKDACNQKSNQKNLGTIKSSNLCCEIVEYSNENETAVCNLASIGLSSFVQPTLISNNEIIIYSKTDCNYCKLAKGLFKKNNLFYTEINLDDDKYRQQVYEELSNKTNKKINSVPQIFLSDMHIGGFMETKDFFKPTFDFNALQEAVSEFVCFFIHLSGLLTLD